MDWSDMAPYLWMLLGSVFFAFMAILTESLKEQFTFPWISMVRSGVATILAFLLAFAARAQLVFLRPKTLWWRSLAGWISMIFGFYAMTHYHVEIVLALTNSYPIWVAILSWPILGVVPSKKSWAALVVSCFGMGLVYSSSTREQSVVSPFLHPQSAIPSAVLASIMSGIALINLHKLRDIDARAIVTHFSAVATTGSFLVWLSIPISTNLIPFDRWAVMKLIGVGIAATVGQLCLTKAFSTGSPANVSIVGLSQVVVAALFKWIVEQRAPGLLSLAGMGLVVASTVWVMASQAQPKSQDVLESDLQK